MKGDEPITGRDRRSSCLPGCGGLRAGCDGLVHAEWQCRCGRVAGRFDRPVIAGVGHGSTEHDSATAERDAGVADRRRDR
jgi:hypothetical protein